MTLPRLTAATMDPALRDLNAKLYLTTRIDTLMFSNWIRTNIHWLREAQRACERQDEQEAYAWLRLQFIERALNSQSVSTPTTTSGPAQASGPAGDLIDFVYEQARRKLL